MIIEGVQHEKFWFTDGNIILATLVERRRCGTAGSRRRMSWTSLPGMRRTGKGRHHGELTVSPRFIFSTFKLTHYPHIHALQPVSTNTISDKAHTHRSLAAGSNSGFQVGTHFHFTQLRSRLIDYNLALRSGVAKGRASYQMALTMAVLDDRGVAPCSYS